MTWCEIVAEGAGVVDADNGAISHSNSPHHVWYRLVDPQGNTFKQCDCGSVRVAADALVDEVRELVKHVNGHLLAGVAPIQLTVFADKTALQKQEPLAPDQMVVPLATCLQNPLLIVVPTQLVDSLYAVGRKLLHSRPKVRFHYHSGLAWCSMVVVVVGLLWCQRYRLFLPEAAMDELDFDNTHLAGSSLRDWVCHMAQQSGICD